MESIIWSIISVTVPEQLIIIKTVSFKVDRIPNPESENTSHVSDDMSLVQLHFKLDK
jgi:hypothetical protein